MSTRFLARTQIQNDVAGSLFRKLVYPRHAGLIQSCHAVAIVGLCTVICEIGEGREKDNTDVVSKCRGFRIICATGIIPQDLLRQSSVLILCISLCPTLNQSRPCRISIILRRTQDTLLEYVSPGPVGTLSSLPGTNENMPVCHLCKSSRGRRSWIEAYSVGG